MRIAIDARELDGQPTGVGRYLAEILWGWNELAGAASHEFVLCAPRPIGMPRTANLHLSTASSPGRGTGWEQLALPRLLKRLRPDVLFAPGYTGPVFCPVPMVVTIHDVSFAAHPEWFSWREGIRRRAITRLAARRAARVVTVSDFSKREVMTHLGIEHSKIDVVYSGVRPAGVRRPTAGDPGSECVVLYVGSIFNRRHVPELIEGFARLARRVPNMRLEIVGDNRSFPRIDLEGTADASGAVAQIRIRAYVTDGELANLYSRASAFVLLSEYEGFGMTPLEALAAGVPIVVLDTEVAREIYGLSALYVKNPQPALVEQALERVLFDRGERDRLREAADAIVRRYSWRESAQRTLQILVAAAASA